LNKTIYIQSKRFKWNKDFSSRHYFQFDKKTGKYHCCICYEKDIIDLQNHYLLMKPPKPPSQLSELEKQQKLFVYDLECYQELIETNLYEHKCNLVCVRSVYGNFYRQHF
jgi:hypothetical protein